MTFFNRLGGRVDHLEETVAGMRATIEGVQVTVGGLDNKLDELVKALSSTDASVAVRAQAVEEKIRNDSERKSRDRSNLLKDGAALFGVVALMITALVGPWREKLATTSEGQTKDMIAISAVREVLAQQGAAIGRDDASIELSREHDRGQDAELREHDRDLAELHGYLTARTGPSAR